MAVSPNTENSLLKLSLESPSGVPYTIQTSTDLIFWCDLTNITSAQGPNIILDALPSAADHEFYRAYSQ